MKYNWPNVVKMFRKLLIDNVQIVGRNDVETRAFMEHFRLEMIHTDTFHPYETDGNLSSALKNMPNYCNYRSCEALREFKQRKEHVLDAVYMMLQEVDDLITDHFYDNWNHPPGYVAPQKVLHPSWDVFTEQIGGKILSAARK